MENEKKVYETPVVTKVEYDVRDQITATGCNNSLPWEDCSQPHGA
jgi:hypothetical protein